MGLLSFLFGPNKKQQQAADAIRAGAAIIDVRTPAEYKQGHVKGSINIPLNELQGKVKKINTKVQPVILCCRSGARAESAKSMLQAKGIESINLGPWQKAASVKNSVG